MTKPEERILKRRDELIKGLQNQIEWIKHDEFLDMDVIYLRLNNYILNNIRNENRLLNYGLEELNNSINLIERGILDETINSVRDIAQISLSAPMKDGSFTFSDKLAKLELDAEFDNYQDINEVLSKSYLNIDELDNEHIHIAAVEQKLANSLNQMYVKKFFNNSNIDSKHLLLLSTYQLMDDNGYDYSEKITQLTNNINHLSDTSKNIR
ncbi:hypothetical protein [Mycoplasma sp. 2634B]|uniref:hypothetical protein n=1 Tax=Mycoplasma sp. 2634B TaxID=3401692 RepID=UPI003AAE3388